MPTGKNTPFNVTVLGFMLAVTLFTRNPELHGAWICSPFVTKLTCHFFHANIFHFACNAMCLWIMRPSPVQTIQAFILAVTAMFATIEPTIGFSAVLYAYMGMNMFRWNVSMADWAMFAVANFITIFIPGVAFATHLAAFTLGFFTWVLEKQMKTLLLKLEEN